MNKQLQTMLLIGMYISTAIHATYNDVTMPNPDMVESSSDVADFGVIDTSSYGIADRASVRDIDKKKKKKRSLKAQAKLNARSKKKKAEEDQKNPSVEKERTVFPAPVIVKKEHNIQLPEDAYLVDDIEAAVFTTEGASIITRSELERPSLDGRRRTLDDMVFEKLMILDAQKFKITPDDDMIDKHLAAVQKDNNLTLDDLKDVFKSSGYTYEEGREQFGMISVINQMLDFKIRSRLIVPDREVVAYYNENPEIQDAAYKIQIGVVPYAQGQSTHDQQKSIEKYLNHDIGYIDIDWQEPFWIEKNELAEDKQFIIELPVGMSHAVEAAEGFQVFKKIEEKAENQRSLDERYREISDLLRRPKYEQLYNEYKNQLMETSAVKYLRS